MQTWSVRFGRILALGSAGTMLTAACATAPAGPAAAHELDPAAVSRQTKVLLADGFDGTALNRAVWTPEVSGTGNPVYNNEQQAYVDRPDVLAVRSGVPGADGGALAVTARYAKGAVTYGGHQYDITSARLNTEKKFQFTYGSVAARMKLPPYPGAWPAFWTLGATAGWPAGGELDVMENIGDPTWTSATAHSPRPGQDEQVFSIDAEHRPAGFRADDWHVYRMDWTPSSVRFLVDEAVVRTVPRAEIEATVPWVFDKPQFLLLNMAVGGDYPESVNHATVPYRGVPAATLTAIKKGAVTMYVDWVRVTQD